MTKTLKDNCVELLKSEDTRKYIRELIRPICQIIYNEIYVYIWFICFYNFIILFLLIFNLYLLFRFLWFVDRQDKKL